MFTPKQIAALKYMIFHAKHASELSKRVLAFLIDQSAGLTKEVCLSLIADRDGYTGDEIREAGYSISRMQSCNGTTHLNAIIDVMGSGLMFSHHYGHMDPARTDDPFNNDGQFAGVPVSKVLDPGHVRTDMRVRYTFWLAREYYWRQAELVVATREDLEKINLRKPGLYPSTERD